MTTKAAPAKSNGLATKVLQLISELEYSDYVTEPISTILKSMRQRVEYEAQQIKTLEDRVDELTQAYHQFNEAYDALASKQRLLTKLQAIVGRNDNLKDIKLWELLEVYLSFVPEAQVADILGFFEWIGYKATRQAVESIIKTHKGRFAVRKEGWDRFISLAGKERRAASTSGKSK
jgi:hypothetical protein